MSRLVLTEILDGGDLVWKKKVMDEEYLAVTKGEQIMPHIIVKLWPGKSDAQKAQLTEAIVRDVTSILNAGDASISVAFEEIAADDWNEQVFTPDILGKWEKLTKEPGYGPRP